MAEKSPSSLGMLSKNNTALFLCDIQEKFRPAMLHFSEVVENAKRIVEVSKVLQLPLIVTEQYPKGLGNTVADIDVQHAVGVFPKTRFSMMIPEVAEALKAASGGKIEAVILFGVEAHVCVEQTALDLLHQGYKVHVVADASTSRSQEDRLLAFERLRQVGCFITTSESVIYKLIGDKDDPKFNELRPLLKNPTKETGLVAKIFRKGTTVAGEVASRRRDKVFNRTESGNHLTNLLSSLECPNCGKKFSRRQDLKRHVTTHQRCSDYLCDLCGSSFRSKAGLNYHVSTSHGDSNNRYRCDACDKEFSSELQLTAHKRNTHQRPRSNFVCKVCDKTFKRSDVYKKHLVVHNGTDDTSTCTTCGKSFSNRTNLKIHMTTHDSSLRIQCEFCREKFRSARRLTAHRLECKQGRRVTFCGLCNLSLGTELKYSEHVRLKHPADYAIQTVFGNSLENNY